MVAPDVALVRLAVALQASAGGVGMGLVGLGALAPLGHLAIYKCRNFADAWQIDQHTKQRVWQPRVA